MGTTDIHAILTFLRRSKGLESAKRYRASLRGKQNTVAEHSWRLGLMALVIAPACNLKIDMGRTLSLALVHDLAEAKTGDIDAYIQIVEGKSLVEQKAVLEDSTMREMTSDLSFGSQIYDLWREYEDAATLEAKFIQALDAIEGFLHIDEDGVNFYLPKEFHADYANSAVAAFDTAAHHVPELHDFLAAIREDLRTQFEKIGVAWIEGDKETSTAII